MAQSKETIKNQIINFYNDALFQKLNAYYGKTTLFNILKIERNENRHSAFLAWLLDVKGSHGLGEEPLKKFMRLLAWTEKDSKYDNPFLAGNYHVKDMEVNTEQSIEKGRMDICIRFCYFDNQEKKRVLVIVENKVYAQERPDQTVNYRDWVKKKESKDVTIIGVFLTPDKEKSCSCEEFIKIDYRDLLAQVLEPLLMLEMSDEIRMLLSDYVINLGQPPVSKGDDKKKDIGTIMAVSKENEESFSLLYRKYADLLDAALFSNPDKKHKNEDDCLKKVYGKERYGVISQYVSDNYALLVGFWKDNTALIRMILNTSLKEIYEDKTKEINKILEIKASSRNNTKYLVRTEDGTYMNEKDKKNNWKPVPKSVASLYVFQAWLKIAGKGTTLDDIRNAFPVEKFTNSEKYPYKYLFYRKEDIETVLRGGTEKGKTYYRAKLSGDDKEGNKYLTWDFFIDNDKKHCLTIQSEEVLSIKMWLKEEFDELVKHAKDKGIVVEEKK